MTPHTFIPRPPDSQSPGGPCIICSAVGPGDNRHDPDRVAAYSLERIANAVDAFTNTEPSGMLGMIGNLFGGQKGKE